VPYWQTVLRKHLRESAGVVVLLGATAALWLPNLWAPASYDEGVYLASLAALKRGDTLGQDVFASQPPGFYALLRLVGFLTDSLTGLRALMLVLGLAGCLAAYFVGRAFADVTGGVLAAIAIALIPVVSGVAGRIDADLPSAVFAVAALAVALFVGVPEKPSRRPLLGSAAVGFLAASSTSIKLLGVTVLVPLAVLAVLGRARSKELIACCLGGASVLLLLVLSNLHAIAPLWSQAVSFHLHARQSGPVADGVTTLGAKIRMIVRALGKRESPLWTAIVGGAALVTFLISLAIAVSRRRADRRLWALWAWVLACALLLAWHRPLFDHDVTILAVAAGIAIATSVAVIGFGTGGPIRLGIACLSIVALAGAAAETGVRLYGQPSTEPGSVERAAAILRATTRPSDRVVADIPFLAFQAHRPMPPSLVDTSYVRFSSGSLDGARVLMAIDDDDVAAVAVGRAFFSVKNLENQIAQRFRHRYQVGSIVVFTRRAAPPARVRLEPEPSKNPRSLRATHRA